MNEDEKAKIILKQLDRYIQVNWNWEKSYVNGIKEGLKEIDRKEAEKMDKLEVALKQIETGIDFVDFQAKRGKYLTAPDKKLLEGQKDGLEFSRGIIEKLIEEGKPIKSHVDLQNRKTITNYKKEKESSAPTQDSK